MLLKISNKIIQNKHLYKINLKKSKKGITLIEAIISVALLSILLVPVSGLVINSFKTNKSAELKQNAAYIGQKTLEELKSYDEITIKDFQGNDKRGFIMLNGQQIQLNEDGTFTGSYNNEELNKNFLVDINLVKNDNFTYEKAEKMDFEFSITGSAVYELSTKNITSRIVNKTIKLVIEDDGELSLYDKAENALHKIDLIEAAANINNNILVNLAENFDKNNFIIEIENKSNKLTTIYVNSELNSKELKVQTILGQVLVKDYNTSAKIGDLYNITVDVLSSGERLFEGKTSNNVILKNK